jgi:hypothetical protein
VDSLSFKTVLMTVSYGLFFSSSDSNLSISNLAATSPISTPC